MALPYYAMPSFDMIDLSRKDDRMKTFTKWPVTFLSAEQMADNGFYYLGRGDEVCCAFCKIEIMMWVEGDDPAKDHQRWAPHCRFVRKLTDLNTGDRDECISRGLHIDYGYESARYSDIKMAMSYGAMPTFDMVNMSRKDDRIKTFEKWPVTFLSAEQMADNGFYYLGCGDKVRCAFCKVELMKWVEGDDPFKEHQHWAPHCRFVHKLPGWDTVDRDGRISSALNVNYVYEAALLRTLFDKSSWMPIKPKNLSDVKFKFNKDRFVQKYNDLHTTEHNKSGSRVSVDAPLHLSGAAHPFYASEDARLRSFQDSPCAMRQKPENLAEAGFFYVGPDDKTKCYYCDGSLKDWETDDVPWEQHARWFGTCAYVQLVKGQDYIKRVMTKGYATLATNVKKEVVSERLCLICYEKERNTCFLPCRHIATCRNCSLVVDNCPLCRRKFHTAFLLNVIWE